MFVPSWIPLDPTSEFSLQNLPFGVFSPRSTAASAENDDDDYCRRCGTIVGDTVIDLALLEEAGLFTQPLPDPTSSSSTTTTTTLPPNTFVGQTTLNRFVSHPKPVWTLVRHRLQALLVQEEEDDNHHPDTTVVRIPADARLRTNAALRRAALWSRHHVQLHLPVHIAEFTDFYASRSHATNVGTMFRGKDRALQPNWLHLPVGYHGRASTVQVSNHGLHRPCGQIGQATATDDSNRQNDPGASRYGPTEKLDFELEVGLIVGGPSNPQGHAMTMEQATQRLFGVVLLNDWSARDLQKYEYVPLGPFTSKHFGTTISPWIVTLDALQPFATSAKASQQATDPPILPYLHDPHPQYYNVDLTVSIQPTTTTTTTTATATTSTARQPPPHVICHSNLRHVHWTFAQLLVHHSVTGCMMQAGDLLGTGTLSGMTPDSYGSWLELSWNGTQAVTIGYETNDNDDTDKDQPIQRSDFLQNGDTITLQGLAHDATSNDNDQDKNTRCYGLVGFGDCTATILPPLTRMDPTTLEDTSNQTNVPSETPQSQQQQQQQQQQPPSPSCTNKDRYTNFKLYGYWRSSSTWRVRIALQAKRIAYETICIDLETKQHQSADYLLKNPLGQVPLLQCTDTVTRETLQWSQSSAILEFLDLAFSSTTTNNHNHGPSWMPPPTQVQTRTAMRQMVEVINSGTQPLQNMYFLKRLETLSEGRVSRMDEAKRVNERGLTALERLVVQHRQQVQAQAQQPAQAQSGLGPYCVGTFGPTLADIYLVPQLANARRFGVEVDRLCPTLVEIETHCRHHEWFVGTEPEAQPDAPSLAKKENEAEQEEQL